MRATIALTGRKSPNHKTFAQRAQARSEQSQATTRPSSAGEPICTRQWAGPGARRRTRPEAQRCSDGHAPEKQMKDGRQRKLPRLPSRKSETAQPAAAAATERGPKRWAVRASIAHRGHGLACKSCGRSEWQRLRTAAAEGARCPAKQNQLPGHHARSGPKPRRAACAQGSKECTVHHKFHRRCQVVGSCHQFASSSMPVHHGETSVRSGAHTGEVAADSRSTT